MNNDEELEQAHLDYESRKEDVLAKLHAITLTTENYVVKAWIKEIVEFIKEKEI